MHFKTTAMPYVGVRANDGTNKNLQNPGRDANGMQQLFRVMTTSRMASSHRSMSKTIKLAMKLTAILILSGCLAASAKGHTQNVSLKAKDAPLEKVFKEIQKQTGYNFLYNDAWLSQTKKVTIQVRNASLKEVLDICFKDQPFTYTILEQTVVLKQKEKSPNSLGGSDEGVTTQPPPPIDITGKVTDADGNPLAGASVKVKGSPLGTTTNNDGVFVLKGVEDDATLEFSFVGYETLNVPVNGRTAIVTTLKMQVKDMKEVVVNKGYYTEKQRYTVGNVTHIDAKVFEQSPVTNPLLALQGRVPGMEITQLTGLPGGGVTVRIQGQNSVAGANDPLVVIDGVPYPINFEGGEMGQRIIQSGSPLNLINPQDIESIDVLKDADATAIYGSRAANGAILITTKKGKAGRTKVWLNLQQGWGKVAKHMDMLNTRQYLDMRYEAYRNDNIPLETLTHFDNYDLTLWDTTRYTDWQKELIGGTAKYTNINAGVSGGNQAVQYLVSASYNRQTTVFPGDFDNKTGGMHFSLSGNSANQRFNIQFSGGYTFNDNHLPSVDLTSQAILMAPNAPALYNQDGSLNWAPTATGRSSWRNPLAYTISTDFINTDKGLISNLTLSYKILQGVVLKTSAGYRNNTQEMYIPVRQARLSPEYRALFNGRQAEFGNRTMNGWNIEPQIDFSRKIGKGQLNGLVGTTIFKSSYKLFQISAAGFPTDELMRTLRAATSITVSSSNSFTTRFNALYGRLGYIHNGKYLVNFNARRDGSNKFGEANRFHNFWSAGGGWVFSEERFLQSSKSWLSFGKLRASYGLTGSDNLPEFEYLSRYGIINSTGIPYQQSIALNVQNIPNPYLQWEETIKRSIGLDLGFFSDRINIGITYANNRSSNQLLGYNLPTLTGFESFSKNLPAVVQNTGWELVFNTVDFKNKNFSWNTSLNITIPRSARLISYPGIEKTASATPGIGSSGNIVVGQPLGVAYAYQFAGINSANGRPYILNIYGDPEASLLSAFSLAKVFLSTKPKYYVGVTNSLSYKGLQLDFSFHFVKKLGTRDMYYNNGMIAAGEFIEAETANQPVSVLNRWKKPGDVGPIPRLSTNSNFSGLIINSDAFYADASFARLENLSLSWQLPITWVSKIHLQGASIYLRGQNLATITNYTGLDPESTGLGMPPLKLWTIGGNFSF